MRTVIDHLGATSHGTCLQIIDTYAVAAVHNTVHVYAEALELGGAHGGNVVLGKTGHKMGVYPVISQRHGHIGLAAAEGSIELMGLRETLVPGG